MILYSGDLIDFISQQNLDYAKKILDGRDCLFAAGNHEFSKYVGEAKEDDAYKLDSLPLVQPYFPNDLTFASKQVAGVNLIAMDNSYYRFTEHQHDLLRKEVEKGLPILLLLHTPLYQEALYHSARSIRPGCAYLVGCPADKMSDYPQDRFEQQKADVATIEMMDTIRTQPLIKAIFAGHFHYNDEGEFAQGKMQYITGGGFAGFGREIILE